MIGQKFPILVQFGLIFLPPSSIRPHLDKTGKVCPNSWQGGLAWQIWKQILLHQVKTCHWVCSAIHTGLIWCKLILFAWEHSAEYWIFMHKKHFIGGKGWDAIYWPETMLIHARVWEIAQATLPSKAWGWIPTICKSRVCLQKRMF